MRQHLKRNRRGFTALEMLTASILILALVVVLLKSSDIYGRIILRSVAARLVCQLTICKSIASLSSGKTAIVVFRPTDAPYTSYHVSSETGEVRSFSLPGGIRIIDTNGFIRNHTLRISPMGQFLDESGELLRNPNPGILTVMSDQTNSICVIRIDPTTGIVGM